MGRVEESEETLGGSLFNSSQPLFSDKAIRRRNFAAIISANVIDIPPALVKPGAVEIVSLIWREYVRKLDELLRMMKRAKMGRGYTYGYLLALFQS